MAPYSRTQGWDGDDLRSNEKGRIINVSVIIPHYPLTSEHDKALRRCVNTIRGQKELIVVVNQGLGFAKSMNLGVSLAKYDYIALLNNDLILGDWDITVLCEPKAVTFPVINGVVQEFTGAFLMIPRSIIENELEGQVYDERFAVGYWEDVDLWTRLKEKNVTFFQKPFDCAHPHPGFTMQFMPSETDFVNRQIYLEKWGTMRIKTWQ